MTETHQDTQFSAEALAAVNRMMDCMEPSCSYSTVNSEKCQVQSVETIPLAISDSPKERLPEVPFNGAKDLSLLIDEPLEQSPLVIDIPVEEKPAPIQSSSKEEKPCPLLAPCFEDKPCPLIAPAVETKPCPLLAPAFEDKPASYSAAVAEVKPSSIWDPDVAEHKLLIHSLLAEVTESLRKQDELNIASPPANPQPVVVAESKPLETEMSPLEYFTSGFEQLSSSKTPRAGKKRSVTFKDLDEDSSPLASFLPAKSLTVKKEPKEVDAEVQITKTVLRKRKSAESKPVEDKENAAGPTPKRSRRPSAIKREIMDHEPEKPKTPVGRTPESARKAPFTKSSGSKNKNLATPKGGAGTSKSSPTVYREDMPESEDSSSCDDSEEEFVIIDERRKKRVFRTRYNNAEDESDDDASSVRAQPSQTKKSDVPRTPKRTLKNVKKEITVGEVVNFSPYTPNRVNNYCIVCDDYIHKPGEKNQGPRRHIFTKHLGVKLFQCMHCDHGSVHDSYHIRLHSKRVHKDESGVIRNLEPEYEDDIRYWMKECFGVMGKSARSQDNSKKSRRMSGLGPVKREPKVEEGQQKETKPATSPSVVPDDDDDFDYDSLTYSPNGPVIMSWEEVQKSNRILD